jgi:Zn-dependent M28 family amino/carboxypeptidase
MLVRKSTDARPQPTQHEILVALSEVSESYLRDAVKALSISRHFAAESANNRFIGELIADRFRSYGYNVHCQGECRNIVALPRNISDVPLLLIGAHYDSVPGTPGADDNATGVAGMLACAKLTSQVSLPKIAVCFVAFNREEDGLIGSFEFVEHGIRQLNMNIREAHILEMIGYSREEPNSQRLPERLPIRIPTVGNFLGLVGNRDSSRLAGNLLRQARSYSPDLPVISLQAYLGLERWVPALWRSDHAPFWKARIPALMWTDTAEFRNPNYHEPGDRPETLNYRFLLGTTQLLLAYTLSTAVRRTKQGDQL